MRRVDAGGFFRPAGEESAGVGHEEMEQLTLGKEKTWLCFTSKLAI